MNLLFVLSFLLLSFKLCLSQGELGTELVGYWVSDENSVNWVWFLSNATFWAKTDRIVQTGLYNVPQETFLDLKLTKFGGFLIPFLYKVNRTQLILVAPEVEPPNRPIRPTSWDKANTLHSAKLPPGGPPGMPSGPPTPPSDVDQNSYDPQLVGPWGNQTLRMKLDFHPNQEFFAQIREFQLQGKWSTNKELNAIDISIRSPITASLPALYQIINDTFLKVQYPPMETILSGSAQRPTQFDETAAYLTKVPVDTGGPPPQSSTTNIPPPPTSGPPSSSTSPPSYTTSLPDHNDETTDPWDNTGIVIVPNQEEGSSENNTGLIVGLCLAAVVIGIVMMGIMFGIRRWRDRSYKYQQT